MRALRLAETVWPRSRQAGRSGNDDRRVAVEHGKLAPIAHPRLMDVPRENDVGTGRRQSGKHALAARERPLARSPRCVRELVMETDDAEHAGRGAAEPCLSSLEGSII